MKQETAASCDLATPQSSKREPQRPTKRAGNDGQQASAGAGAQARPRLSEDKRFKIFSGSANRPLAEEICKFLGVPARRDPDTTLRRWRNLLSAPRKCPWRRTYSWSSPPVARSTTPGRAADHDRRAQARLGRPDHRGGPVLRLCAAGPQGPPPRRHYLQAGRRSSHHRRRQSRPVRGSACGADPGLLQYPCRSFIRQPGAGRLLPGPEPAEPHRRLARTRAA